MDGLREYNDPEFDAWSNGFTDGFSEGKSEVEDWPLDQRDAYLEGWECGIEQIKQLNARIGNEELPDEHSWRN